MEKLTRRGGSWEREDQIEARILRLGIKISYRRYFYDLDASYSILFTALFQLIRIIFVVLTACRGLLSPTL